MEKTKTTKFLGSFSLSKNGGGAGGTTNYDDLTNKPKVNGIVLSGNKTSADLGITTLTPFPSTWPTTGKFEDLLAAIREDTIAVKGASFLGEVTFDDLPANLGNAEIKIEILEGTTSATKVIHSVITSGNRQPYRWEYTSWNSGNSNSGWISFQLPLTAGTGISIENNVISTTVDNVYTQSNLLAGKGIEIVNEPVEGGIDEHTLACWHFDGTKNDVVTGLEALMGNYDTSNKKFGTGAYDTSSAYSETNISSLGLNPLAKSATIDFWFKCITSSESCNIGFGTYSASNLAIYITKDFLTLKGENWSSRETLFRVVPGLDFNHYAIQFNKETNKASVFFNGKKVAEQTPKDFSASSFAYFVAYSYYRKNAIDELRISDIARYTEDFEPPTKAYSVAVPTGNKVINNTGVTSINTKKGNVTLTANDINVTYTHEGAETTTSIKEFADTVDHSIENLNSLIPVNAYTAENLIAGKNITIEEVLPEGGIDNHTIACWHFDENLNPTILNGDISKFNITTTSSTVQTSQFRFPTGALYLNGAGAYFTSIISNVDFFSKDFTIDFWFRVTTDIGNTIFGISNKTSHDVRSFPLYLHYGALGNSGDIKLKINNTLLNGSILSTSTWYHIATVFKYIDKSISVFVDGKKYGDTITLDSLPGNANNISFFTPSSVGEYIDELRVSDIARPLNPDGKFPVPTKPYSVAESTGKVEINNAITKTSQLTNDSGFITSVNSKTGNVILTGADIQTTYTYNSEETTTTVNAFADAVLHDIDNVVSLIPTKAVTSDNVTKIVKLTQAEYDQLETKDDSTFYAIVG